MPEGLGPVREALLPVGTPELQPPPHLVLHAAKVAREAAEAPRGARQSGSPIASDAIAIAAAATAAIVIEERHVGGSVDLMVRVVLVPVAGLTW